VVLFFNRKKLNGQAKEKHTERSAFVKNK